LNRPPNPSSRVTLETRKRFYWNAKGKYLHWSLPHSRKQPYGKIIELVGQARLGFAGIGTCKSAVYLQDEMTFQWPSFTSGHLASHGHTTRMSDDPKKGVVDANCKVHGCKICFIAGASCFTTSAATKSFPHH
jgi:choline dehydrogenase-like flavoprotein